MKALVLNGVVKPFWDRWPLSCPSIFLHIETLHHFHHFTWDHDIKWCIEVVTPAELDFQFSFLQTPVGYHAFNNRNSKLKQVTGHDHHTVQQYIVMSLLVQSPLGFLSLSMLYLTFITSPRPLYSLISC